MVFITILLIFWYIKSRQHPTNFPPGPRFPLPIIGDAHTIGKDFSKGLINLSNEYGKVVGLWLGSKRAVVISDFDILQDILNKNETAYRSTTKVGRKFLRWFTFY